jgi:AraC-like DNA-binding protein
MSPLELTGLTRVALLLLQGAERLGLDRDELIRSAGFREEELRDPDGRVSVAKIWSVWRAAARCAADTAFGLHLGESATVREFGLVGYTMLHSSDLEHALVRMARFGRIISELLAVRLEEEGEVARLLLASAARLDELRHPVDARLAAVLAVAREITKAEIVPVEAAFPYPRPASSSEHQRFFRAPLKFEQPCAMLAFRKKDLERPIVAADETLGGYLDRLADEVVASLAAKGTFAENVRRAIWTDLSEGQPAVEQIASALGVSVRTLQRRLKEEGTSFVEVLDAFRRRIAIHLLRDRTLAVYEIAFLLGYSEPSTFFRAFRRWEGTSPSAYRRSLIA